MELWWKEFDKKYPRYLQKDLPHCYFTINPIWTGLELNWEPSCANLKGVWKEAIVKVSVTNLKYQDGICLEEQTKTMEKTRILVDRVEN